MRIWSIVEIPNIDANGLNYDSIFLAQYFNSKIRTRSLQNIGR